MGKLRIDVLGASFAVQANENDEYLKKLLSYYRQITDAIQGSARVGDPLQTSILAGLTLVDELYKAKGSTFTIKVGNPIPYTTFDKKQKNYNEWADWVKQTVYAI